MAFQKGFFEGLSAAKINSKYRSHNFEFWFSNCSIKNDLGLLWKSYAYVLSRKWPALSIGGNGSIPRPTNHFLLKEKEKMFVFSKMILRSTQKFLRILPLFEASVVFLSTQKFFRNSNLIAVAFKTCFWCHIFVTRCLGGFKYHQSSYWSLNIQKT